MTEADLKCRPKKKKTVWALGVKSSQPRFDAPLKVASRRDFTKVVTLHRGGADLAVAGFLAAVVEQSRPEFGDRVVFTIFDQMERWFFQHEDIKCDSALREAANKIDLLSADAVVAFLTITNPARTLPSRWRFSEAAAQRLTALVGAGDAEELTRALI